MAVNRDDKFYDFMFKDKRETSDSNGFMAFERDDRFYTFIPSKTMEPKVGVRGESGNSSWKQESSQNKDNNSNNATSLNKRN
ncbi:hypothetical protein SLA2020_146700 [Shorea laevis]